ncbi:MAG TPA: hypothetical protein VGY56_14105 [Verrucomicrobiae bacterium]|nr:hypothetical protein [Verrucomicrobiae bacterium]
MNNIGKLLPVDVFFIDSCAIHSPSCAVTLPCFFLKDKKGSTYEGAALESSSYLKTNPLRSWITANIGFHHIHHVIHLVPFYCLPKL